VLSKASQPEFTSDFDPMPEPRDIDERNKDLALKNLYLKEEKKVAKEVIPAHAVYLRQPNYIKNCIRTLDMELSLIPINQECKSDTQDGLFQVILWRLNDKISTQEFSLIYSEWLKLRNISSINQTTSRFQESAVHSQTHLVSLFIKHGVEMMTLLPQMLSVLREEHNRIN